jgi:hypothetical protein
VEFAGREAFIQWSKAEKKKNKAFKPSGGRIDAWNQAVTDAELAFSKDRDSRLADLVQYLNDKSVDAVVQGKRKFAKRKLQEMGNVTTPLTKKQKLDASLCDGRSAILSSPDVLGSTDREQSSMGDMSKSDSSCSSSTQAIPPGASSVEFFFF